jgi:large subunit ribosomal protein L7/L12
MLVEFAMAKMQDVIEQIKGMTLIEVADLVKGLEEAFGVSAAMPVAAASAAVASAAAVPAAQEEKAQYKVTLKDGGAKKIDVIKALRKVLPAMNLTDAKAAVENAPTVVAEAASKDDAKKIKEELEAAGAKVELS